MLEIQTFIFIHDQEILLDFISHKKFSNLKNLKYVFLGNADNSKVKELSNVIISKNLKINIEEYPKLTSFTGWYSLWKNNFIDSNYINLFEYDINLVDNFEEELNKILNENIDIVGYIPINVHNRDFIIHSPWCQELSLSVKKNYIVDVNEFISSLPEDLNCSITSNHTFEKKSFESYMKWVEPMIDDIKNSPLSGHEIERSISLYYLIENKKTKIIPKVLTHFQLDSHQTQGIFHSKFNKQYKYLLQ